MHRRIKNTSDSDDPDTWQTFKQIIIKDIPEFAQISMQFYFKLTKSNKEPSHLLFARQE